MEPSKNPIRGTKCFQRGNEEGSESQEGLGRAERQKRDRESYCNGGDCGVIRFGEIKGRSTCGICLENFSQTHSQIIMMMKDKVEKLKEDTEETKGFQTSSYVDNTQHLTSQSPCIFYIDDCNLNTTKFAKYSRMKTSLKILKSILSIVTEEDLQANLGGILATFDTNGVCLLVDCAHIFHKRCIKDWIKEYNTCPICRKKIYEKALELQPGLYQHYLIDLMRDLSINDSSFEMGLSRVVSENSVESNESPSIASHRYIEDNGIYSSEDVINSANGYDEWASSSDQQLSQSSIEIGLSESCSSSFYPSNDEQSIQISTDECSYTSEENEIDSISEDQLGIDVVGDDSSSDYSIQSSSITILNQRCFSNAYNPDLRYFSSDTFSD
ncbi:unnamed protein product [Moneuplotes crassus]|uniref:RING-type domain-containing protein n=1 Tax=Euplotes crassus TaxID=5936 RepID=A0AAD1XFK2_EUPCR|nr:unnamed protein product [Moneuplotes crassus]